MQKYRKVKVDTLQSSERQSTGQKSSLIKSQFEDKMRKSHVSSNRGTAMKQNDFVSQPTGQKSLSQQMWAGVAKQVKQNQEELQTLKNQDKAKGLYANLVKLTQQVG